MRVRFSFILEIEDSEGGLCRIQEIAHEVAEEFGCTLTGSKRDDLACACPVSEDATS